MKVEETNLNEKELNKENENIINDNEFKENSINQYNISNNYNYNNYNNYNKSNNSYLNNNNYISSSFKSNYYKNELSQSDKKLLEKYNNYYKYENNLDNSNCFYNYDDNNNHNIGNSITKDYLNNNNYNSEEIYNNNYLNLNNNYESSTNYLLNNNNLNPQTYLERKYINNEEQYIYNNPMPRENINIKNYNQNVHDLNNFNNKMSLRKNNSFFINSTSSIPILENNSSFDINKYLAREPNLRSMNEYSFRPNYSNRRANNILSKTQSVLNYSNSENYYVPKPPPPEKKSSLKRSYSLNNNNLNNLNKINNNIFEYKSQIKDNENLNKTNILDNKDKNIVSLKSNLDKYKFNNNSIPIKSFIYNSKMNQQKKNNYLTPKIENKSNSLINNNTLLKNLNKDMNLSNKSTFYNTFKISNDKQYKNNNDDIIKPYKYYPNRTKVQKMINLNNNDYEDENKDNNKDKSRNKIDYDKDNNKDRVINKKDNKQIKNLKKEEIKISKVDINSLRHFPSFNSSNNILLRNIKNRNNNNNMRGATKPYFYNTFQLDSRNKKEKNKNLFKYSTILSDLENKNKFK